MQDEVNKEELILVVDKDTFFGNTICSSLNTYGYQTAFVSSGEEALNHLSEGSHDLVIADRFTLGKELYSRIRDRASDDYLPLILSIDDEDKEGDMLPAYRVDDFIHKPLRLPELILRVDNLLKVRRLHQRLKEQSGVIEMWSKSLEEIVAKQDSHLAKLKRFVSPQVANAAMSDGIDDPLLIHRRHVSVMFIDLRGFTAFSEAAEPEEVREVLEQYYAAVGTHALQHGGTIGNFSGDAVMVFFNDPVEISDHQLRAVRAAMEIRSEVKKLTGVWKDRGHSLCFGLGLAEGYATIGGIGFQDYLSYTAIGTVTNLAARFCEAAENCDILTSHRFWSRVEGFVSAESRGEITPRGIPYAIQAYSLVALREPSDPQ